MKAKSIKGKSPADIQSAVRQSMPDGYKPTLAFVFLTQLEDIDAAWGNLESWMIAGPNFHEKTISCVALKER